MYKHQAQDSDGVNKAYVDTVASGNSEFDKLRDTTIKKATPDASLSINKRTKDKLYTTQVIRYYPDGATITDGPFTTYFQNSIITSGTAKGWVRRVETTTDPVVGSVIRITYDDDTLGGTAFSGNESNIAQDELQRGLEVPYLSTNTAAGVDASFWVTCGIDYGIALIGNPGSGYVAGETFTVPCTAFSGGATPANDATITIDTVNGTGQIPTVSITGTTGRTTRPVGEGAGIASCLKKQMVEIVVQVKLNGK